MFPLPLQQGSFWSQDSARGLSRGPWGTSLKRDLDRPRPHSGTCYEAAGLAQPQGPQQGGQRECVTRCVCVCALVSQSLVPVKLRKEVGRQGRDDGCASD